MEITYDRVHELFRYDNGKLFWTESRGKGAKGLPAGCAKDAGYKCIGVDGKRYYAHRLVWLYHNGYFPENGVDHINRDKGDNRIENLREVSQTCNARNSGNYKHNTSGIKGVHFVKNDNLWMARVRVNDKYCYLGESKDFDEAVLLRYTVEQCLGWESCDSMSPAHEYALKNNLVSK